MAEYPQSLENYYFSGERFKHLVCRAAEGRYEYTLKDRLFFPDGQLYDRFGGVVAHLVKTSIVDPQGLIEAALFDGIAVVKNPLNRSGIYEEEGYKNALLETPVWMYLATVQRGHLQVERPVRKEFYDNLKKYLAQATVNVNTALIRPL